MNNLIFGIVVLLLFIVKELILNKMREDISIKDILKKSVKHNFKLYLILCIIFLEIIIGFISNNDITKGIRIILLIYILYKVLQEFFYWIIEIDFKRKGYSWRKYYKNCNILKKIIIKVFKISLDYPKVK